MAAKKVVGKPFKKGQSGNPAGRPKMSDLEKKNAAAKRELQLHIATEWPRYMNVSKAEFEKILKSKNLKMADLLMFKQVESAMKGNRQALEFMLNYMGFKPADKQEVSIAGSLEDALEQSYRRDEDAGAS